MHTCISWHGRERSWRSCPRQVNVGDKNTPSMHHRRRRNVTTPMVGLKNGHICKNLTQNGEPQRSSWGTRGRRRRWRGHWYDSTRKIPMWNAGLGPVSVAAVQCDEVLYTDFDNICAVCCLQEVWMSHCWTNWRRMKQTCLVSTLSQVPFNTFFYIHV